MQYYQDINLWSLNGSPLSVSEDNDHLGLLVSSLDEEIKNVDRNIAAARRTLHTLLGSEYLLPQM